MPVHNHHQLKIIKIIPETNDAATFVLEPLHDWKPPYKAGQFLTLVFDTRYGEKRRSYSLTSSPVMDEPMSITVKRVENGEFSRWLLLHAKEGDILQSSGISGFFVLPVDLQATEQFFFLAAGSGITPCYALIRTLLKETNKKIVLIYSNRSKEDTIFKSSLEALQEANKERFQIEFLFSDQQDVYKSRLSNWLLQQLLKKYITAGRQQVLFYVCGPFEYMETVTITLLNEGMLPKNIRKENFNSFARIIKPVPPDTDLHVVTIHFNDAVYTIKVQYPQTVLAAAKAHHIALPYSCEAGRCGSCAATCTNGKFWMAYNEVLMDDELAKGRILCCQAYPVEGDAEIIA